MGPGTMDTHMEVFPLSLDGLPRLLVVVVGPGPWIVRGPLLVLRGHVDW